MALRAVLRFLFLAFLPALVVAGTRRRAPATQFISSCNPNTIKLNGVKLTATCYNIIGEAKCSTLDLSKCLKNVAGSIQDDPDGKGPSVANECIECTNSKDVSGIGVSGPQEPQIMRCKCDNKLGLGRDRWPVSWYDLNQVIDNSNGVMVCHGQRSQPC